MALGLMCSFHITEQGTAAAGPGPGRAGPRTDIPKGNLTLNTSKWKMTEKQSGTALIGPIILTLPKSDEYNPKPTEPQCKKANQSTVEIIFAANNKQMVI